MSNKIKINLKVNGENVTYEVEPQENLLRALRNNFNWDVKCGCEAGECGTCSVLLDGKEVKMQVKAGDKVLCSKYAGTEVKYDGKEEELPFDYGFVCLGMRANAPIWNDIQEAFVGEDVEVLNIGDSVRARRIIDGTDAGRHMVLNTLERLNYL